MARARLTGQWAKAGILLAKSTVMLPILANQMMEDLGKEGLQMMKDHIIRQDLDWKPLSRSWAREKGNDYVYIDTGYLLENISTRYVKGSATKSKLFIGGSAWKVHKPSGQKLSTVMYELEYGSPERNLPARPLVRIVQQELGDKIRGRLQSFSILFR